MPDATVIQHLVLIIGAATAGGLLALWLRQPIVLGYLGAGVAVGPFTPGPRADFDALRFLTEVGVALLLFVMGAGLPPSRFRHFGPVVAFGGLLQIGLTLVLGLALAPLLDLHASEAVLFGAILAQSSSAVIIKTLDDRGEAGSAHGRIALGMSVVQDLLSVPLLLLLLFFVTDEPRSPASVPLVVGEVLGLAVASYVVGRLVWPRLLGWVVRFGSGELTLLATLALALGGALAVNSLGLSFAVGAFLAGLVVAESTHRQEVINRILPLRDAFAALFFVSMGALFDPAVVAREPARLAAVLGATVIGKAALTGVVVGLFRYPANTALLAGLLLAQIGEFAFILGDVGLREGVVSESLFSLVIAVAIMSIALSALVLDSAPPVLAFLSEVTGLQALRKRKAPRVHRSRRRLRVGRRPRTRPTPGTGPPGGGPAGTPPEP